MAMPTIELIVSRYLFNLDSPPVELKDENLIRSAGQKGDPYTVDMNEFMTTGGGRFAGIERFNFVRNFLGGKDDEYLSGGATLAPGTYTRDRLLNEYNIPLDRGILAIKQYYQGC